MATIFASHQPAGSKNYVENVAIVGIGGRSGSFMAKALMKTGKHRVTAITRPDSTNKMLEGLHDIKKTDYSHESLVAVLQGQDVLIITMAITAPPDTQKKLIDAAVEAGVKYIMPNEWGIDMEKVEASKETFLRDRLLPIREYIEKIGGDKTKWIGLCCGFWYEFSLAGTEARYGFDFDKKTLTLYNEGTTKINTSTWPQVARAVAALLSLKISPDNESNKSPTLSQWNNKAAHVSSFFVSQKDMFESVLRVTGDKESDWTITHEDVRERYKRGLKMMQEGQMVGFGIVLYSRVFYDDGAGDFNKKLDNNALGLPEENFDEATKVAIDMALAGETNAIH